MDIRELTSIVGVLVALALGVYNVVRTRLVARTVDTLLIQDKFFDTLRTAIDTQTLLTKEVTALRKQRQRLSLASRHLSTPKKHAVDECIAGINKTIEDIESEIVSAKAMVKEAGKLTAPEAPDRELVKKSNTLLGQVRVRHSNAVLGQATTDGLISDADDLLAAVQI
jgi:hypothetical protein